MAINVDESLCSVKKASNRQSTYPTYPLSMKKLVPLLFVIAAFISRPCNAQLIPNGGFELGDRNQVPGAFYQGQLNPDTALPSWSLSSPYLFYNNYFLDSGGAWFATSTFYTAPYLGQYSLVLQAGWPLTGPNPNGPFTFSLSQNVNIPSTSRSITFRGKQIEGLPVSITLGGQPRTPILLSSSGG